MKALYFLLLFFSLNSFATDTYEVVILEHKFIPDTLVIPANKKIKLMVINKDDTAEEFESFELRREKIVPAHGQIKVNIGPLEPGEYNFFGEFHQKTAQGKIIVK
ncbi:MAG: cupredoxin domain-containing protein [Rickettsiales bacterium]|jgi:hypothetical protein|nr:cupredoxin domain-containing protein [Rickettsiales bacterium]